MLLTPLPWIVLVMQATQPAAPEPLASSAPAGAGLLLRFVVVAPPRENPPDEISVALSLDNWDEAGRVLRRVADDLYVGEWRFDAPRDFQYKFRRGRNWQTVEKSASGDEVQNRAFSPAAGVTRQVVLHVVQRWADDAAAVAGVAAEFNQPASTPRPRAATRSGDIRVHEDFESPQLGNRRRVLVYLPPGYADEPARYPVLYMHDGQNVFDAATSFTGVEWGADEAAEALIRARTLPKLILVAIENNADRMFEYTPWHDEPRQGGGRGDAYVDFIADTLKPFIDRTYRTRPERAHTGIAGSSLGGLISLHALQRRPEIFSKAGVISPALFWAEGRILQRAREIPLAPDARVWLEMGTEEGRGGGRMERFTRATRDCRALAEIWISQGRTTAQPQQIWPPAAISDAQRPPLPDVNFFYDEVEGGLHHESAWAKTIGSVLLFLFSER